MTANETQANPDTISSIMTVFGSPAHVLFYFGSSKSFVNTSFSLYTSRIVTVEAQIGSYDPSRRADNSYFYVQRLQNFD